VFPSKKHPFFKITKRFKDMKSHKVIFVNPVHRIPTQGRDKQMFTIIDPKTGDITVTQGMNKTKEFGAATNLSFQYNATTNRLQTGLDVSVTNPLFQMEIDDVMVKYNLSHEWREILKDVVTKSEIKKQLLYEIYDDVVPGYYTSEVAGGVTIFNFSKFSKTPEKPNYLQTFNITLYDGPNRFTDETPRGRLAIQLIENHTAIAKNKNTANNSIHLFFVSEQHEAEIEKARKQDIIDEAAWEKVNLQKNGSDYKNYQVACLLTTNSGKPIIKNNATKEMVKNAITEYLNDSSHQMNNIDKFMKIISMLKEKESRERFDIMYLIQQAINTGVIKLSDGYYIWHSKSGVPNMHKHNNYEKFVSLLQNEAKTWDPEDTSTTNWYGDLYNEVKQKGIWFE